MQSCSQGVLPEIGKSQQRGKRHPSHTAHQRPLLGFEPVRPYPFVTHQVECLVLVGIVCLLKNRHVVSSAFMEISVFVGIDRIDLKPYHPEVFPGHLAGFADVFHVAHAATLAGEYEYFLHPRVGDYLHLVLYLLRSQPHPVYIVITVESTVDAVILTVVGYVKRCEQIHVVAEMLACLYPGSLSHLLDEGLRRR